VAILERAAELDDDCPDDVCPGCGQDITGWREWPAHYRPGVELSHTVLRDRATDDRPWPFVVAAVGQLDALKGGAACPWDRDMLAARLHRRMLLRGER
jgi:hypothetical protein